MNGMNGTKIPVKQLSAPREGAYTEFWFRSFRSFRYVGCVGPLVYQDPPK